MGSCMSTHSAGAAAAPRSRSGRRWKRRRRAESGEKSRRGGGLFAWSADPAKAPGGGGPTEEELLRVPGRMVLSGSSDGACLYTQQGRKGTNQDAMVVWENFASIEDTFFCGVFDGHGPYGHMVAKKVRDSLPVKVCDQWNSIKSEHSNPNQNGSVGGSTNSEETASMNIENEWTETLDSSEDLPDLFLTLRQALLKAFKLMDKELKLHATIDCFCSGSTAVTIIKQGLDLVIGNIGDSRAVLGTRDKDNALAAVQLTVDLKPNLPREAARIQQFKGRVFALQDEPEVARVWLPNSDSPGLAMARAFGDFCLKDYGLISVPDVSYHRLTERDEFIVLATDGVWDVLSNKEVVDVVASAPSRATSARAVVDSAVRAWRLKYPTSKSDDCAVVCLFLSSLPSPDQTAEAISPNIPEEQTEPSALGVPDGETTENQEFPFVTDSCEQHDSALHQTSPDVVSEIVPVDGTIHDKLHEGCHSTKSIAECISTAEEQEWSALEGVTRVNSLVNLPRFLASDKKSGSRRKWF